jgi:hypothetical protein
MTRHTRHCAVPPLPAMLETPDALSVPNRGALRQAIVKKELMACRPNVRNYISPDSQLLAVGQHKSPVLLLLQHAASKTSTMALNGPVNRKLTISLRLTGSR